MKFSSYITLAGLVIPLLIFCCTWQYARTVHKAFLRSCLDLYMLVYITGWGNIYCALCGWGCPHVTYLAGLLNAAFRMKLFKVFFMFLLLAGDYHLKPASLGVFPQQDCGSNGRANLPFAPIEPFPLYRSTCSGGVMLLVVAVALMLRRFNLKIFGPTTIFF